MKGHDVDRGEINGEWTGKELINEPKYLKRWWKVGGKCSSRGSI